MNEFEKTDFPASIIKRGLAFIVDAVVASLPVMVLFVLFAGMVMYIPVASYPAPAFGFISTFELPDYVEDSLNSIENDDGSSYQVKNVSFSATSMRIITYLSMVFYLVYSAACTYLFEGKTVGKRLMNIQVVHTGDIKPEIWCVIREFLMKTVLYSIPVFPIVSLVMIFVTPKHYALHDLLTKTMVTEA